MCPDTTIPTVTAAKFSGQSEHRHSSRTPTFFSLLYSCMDSGQMLIGDGVVSDLSSRGIGIRGDQLVAPGVTVTLFIDLPGVKSRFALPRAEFPGLKDADLGWRWRL